MRSLIVYVLKCRLYIRSVVYQERGSINHDEGWGAKCAKRVEQSSMCLFFFQKLLSYNKAKSNCPTSHHIQLLARLSFVLLSMVSTTAMHAVKRIKRRTFRLDGIKQTLNSSTQQFRANTSHFHPKSFHLIIFKGMYQFSTQQFVKFLKIIAF